jgi:hypothetical protein
MTGRGPVRSADATDDADVTAGVVESIVMTDSCAGADPLDGTAAGGVNTRY